MEIVLPAFLGILFGFVLHRVGASNPHIIINMLRLKNLHLMKVILMAIGISSILVFLGLQFGFVDASHFSIKPNYVGVFVGGILLGIGWVISGYCPGTGIVAAGEGRFDAWFFILGGLTGAFIFLLTFSMIMDTFLFNELGGMLTIAQTNQEKSEAVLNMAGIIPAGVIGLVMIVVAFMLPNREDNR